MSTEEVSNPATDVDRSGIFRLYASGDIEAIVYYNQVVVPTLDDIVSIDLMTEPAREISPDRRHQILNLLLAHGVIYRIMRGHVSYCDKGEAPFFYHEWGVMADGVIVDIAGFKKVYIPLAGL